MATVHPTAIVDPRARLDESAVVGPYACIEADVVIGPRCQIMHGAHIGRWTTLGADNQIYPGTCLGLGPQDLGYHGEEAYTVIGDGNIMREGVTIHRGNRPETTTVIGNHNYFMVNSHVAHNCQLGNHVILVNGALLAGHVEVGDRAIISGNCQVHQFVRIGAFAMMRGGSSANKDIPPYCINDGLSWIRAINLVGLKRNGFDAKRIRAITDAFKLLFRSGLPLATILEQLQEPAKTNPDLQLMLDFIRNSKRGIGHGRRGSRE